MAVCITHLLDRWADTNELLEVELVDGPHPRAGIVHDDSTSISRLSARTPA